MLAPENQQRINQIILSFPRRDAHRAERLGHETKKAQATSFVPEKQQRLIPINSLLSKERCPLGREVNNTSTEPLPNPSDEWEQVLLKRRGNSFSDDKYS